MPRTVPRFLIHRNDRDRIEKRKTSEASEIVRRRKARVRERMNGEESETRCTSPEANWNWNRCCRPRAVSRLSSRHNRRVLTRWLHRALSPGIRATRASSPPTLYLDVHATRFIPYGTFALTNPPSCSHCHAPPTLSLILSRTLTTLYSIVHAP